jgi:hypothetical protein
VVAAAVAAITAVRVVLAALVAAVLAVLEILQRRLFQEPQTQAAVVVVEAAVQAHQITAVLAAPVL